MPSSNTEWRSIYGENVVKHFKDQLHFETKKSLTSNDIQDYWEVIDEISNSQ